MARPRNANESEHADVPMLPEQMIDPAPQSLMTNVIFDREYWESQTGDLDDYRDIGRLGPDGG